ncbi:carboxylate-amine ligase [Rhodovulum sp. DZ06]|uniref:carboxylate-amine ligase n=1 Tax=Rhodovulum sp. DZ06 TaxID=3425126 RepID=UPI003D3461BA
MSQRPGLTVGIEEEYLVVDRETRDLVDRPDPGFLEKLSELVGEQVAPEYLQCQVEVGTGVHKAIPDAVAELTSLRAKVADAAEAFGYAPIAASTHPFGKWRAQTHTRKKRYDELSQDLGATVRRLLICGCHVHVGIEDEDLRIDLMNQVAYFLPHLLALSTSSPFWEGEDTGLASYRLTVFDALPRTGLPDQMNSFSEYRRLVEHLVKAGCIEDATRIWWDIRPSDKFPTLEQRVTDVCSRVRDAGAVAALYQCLLAFLWRLKSRNQRWRVYPGILIEENRWRAQRYGARGELVDHGAGRLSPFPDLCEELIDMLRPEAEALGCVKELLHIRRIAGEGTSAERQRAVHGKAMADGAGPEEAARAVVDALIAEFRES